MVLVHIGCGDQVGASWLNFDMSPMLFVQRLPGGSLIKKIIGGSDYVFPSEVKYGNIAKEPLVPAGSAQGAYASHVLEHMTLQDAKATIHNIFDMLAPGGVFRLIVPDLEWRAKLYLEELASGNAGASSDFMRSTILGQEDRRGFVRSVRSLFSGSSHLWMWDYLSMKAALEEAGFTQVRRTEPGDAQNPAFREIENLARFWSEPAGHAPQRELSMECVKPA